MRKILNYFSKGEIALWCLSVCVIAGSFCFPEEKDFFTLSASLVGVTSLILNAKGNPVGQVLMVIFSFMYGIISYTCRYYGEMLTYLGMTMPMAVVALVSWMKNPYKGNRGQVKVNRIRKRESAIAVPLTVLVTVVFYFVLKFFDTSNMALSTVSVTTSFLAVYLTFRRSCLFALAYAANDIVLIALWMPEAVKDTRYVAVTVCFAVFLINDVYGFLNWKKMKNFQAENK